MFTPLARTKNIFAKISFVVFVLHIFFPGGSVAWADQFVQNEFEIIQESQKEEQKQWVLYPETLSNQSPWTIQPNEEKTIHIYPQIEHEVSRTKDSYYNLWPALDWQTEPETQTWTLQASQVPLVYDFVIETHDLQVFEKGGSLLFGEQENEPLVVWDMETENRKSSLEAKFQKGWIVTQEEEKELQQQTESPVLSAGEEEFFAPDRQEEKEKKTPEQQPDSQSKNISEAELDFFAPQQEKTKEKPQQKQIEESPNEETSEKKSKPDETQSDTVQNEKEEQETVQESENDTQDPPKDSQTVQEDAPKDQEKGQKEKTSQNESEKEPIEEKTTPEQQPEAPKQEPESEKPKEDPSEPLSWFQKIIPVVYAQVTEDDFVFEGEADQDETSDQEEKEQENSEQQETVPEETQTQSSQNAETANEDPETQDKATTEGTSETTAENENQNTDAESTQSETETPTPETIESDQNDPALETEPKGEQEEPEQEAKESDPKIQEEVQETETAEPMETESNDTKQEIEPKEKEKAQDDLEFEFFEPESEPQDPTYETEINTQGEEVIVLDIDPVFDASQMAADDEDFVILDETGDPEVETEKRVESEPNQDTWRADFLESTDAHWERETEDGKQHLYRIQLVLTPKNTSPLRFPIAFMSLFRYEEKNEDLGILYQERMKDTVVQKRKKDLFGTETASDITVIEQGDEIEIQKSSALKTPIQKKETGVLNSISSFFKGEKDPEKGEVTQPVADFLAKALTQKKSSTVRFEKDFQKGFSFESRHGRIDFAPIFVPQDMTTTVDETSKTIAYSNKDITMEYQLSADAQSLKEIITLPKPLPQDHELVQGERYVFRWENKNTNLSLQKTETGEITVQGKNGSSVARIPKPFYLDYTGVLYDQSDEIWWEVEDQGQVLALVMARPSVEVYPVFIDPTIQKQASETNPTEVLAKNGHILVQTLGAQNALPEQALDRFLRESGATDTLEDNVFQTQKNLSEINLDFGLETRFKDSETITKELSITKEQQKFQLTMTLQSDQGFDQTVYKSDLGDTKVFVRKDQKDLVTYTQPHKENTLQLKEWIYALEPNTETGSRYEWALQSKSPLTLLPMPDGRLKVKSGTVVVAYFEPIEYYTATGEQKTVPYQIGTNQNSIVIEIPEPVENYPLLIDPTLDLGTISSTERSINNTNKYNFPITCEVTSYDADGTLTYEYSFNNSDWHAIGSQVVDGDPTPYSGTYTQNVDFESDAPTGYSGNGTKTLYCKVSGTGVSETTSLSINKQTSTDSVDNLDGVVVSSSVEGYYKGTSLSVYGDGADGSVSINPASGTTNINTDTIASGRSAADGEAFEVSSLGTATITVTGSGTDGTAATSLSSSISSGDEVLLINLQGTSGSNSNVGKYEFCEVSSVSSATITCSANLQNTYGSSQKLVVQRVPNYTSVTINSGKTLTASAWNGTLGGVVAFRATGSVDVSGSIDVTGKGYRKSSNQNIGISDGVTDYTNYQGEGYCGVGTTSRSANCGGGGAGKMVFFELGKGGAGGSHASGANNGGECTADFDGIDNAGIAGSSYGSADLSTLYFGGAGGNGGDGENNVAGGNGGGIIFLSADTLSMSGSITADGDIGESDTAASSLNGGGGGGAGGSILIQGGNITIGTNKISADGGSGGSGGSDGGGDAGDGGAGSDGRTAIYFENFVSGSTSSPSHYQGSQKKYYYNSASGEGSGQTLTLTASTSAGSASWDCGLAFGSNPTADSSSPYTQSYTVSTGAGDQEIVCIFDDGSAESQSTIEFVEDNAGPSGGSITYPNGTQSTLGISVTVARGTDNVSGMSSQNSDYQLEYQKATYAGSTCGSFGSWTDAGVSETATGSGYTYNASGFDECYKFRYTVSDYLGNTTTYTSSNETIIVPANTVPNAPTLVSPANGTSSDDETPTLSAQYSDPDGGDTGYTQYRISSSSAANCLSNTNIVASGQSAQTTTANESTTWTPGSSIGSDGTYYWCARNYDESEYSSWTSMGTYILDTVPTTITIISGNDQTGTMNTAVTENLKIQVTNDSGNPVEGVTVSFSFGTLPSNPAPQNHSLSATSVDTDSNGYAETTLTLGDRAGAYTVVANFTGCTTLEADRTFTATEEEYFVMTISDTEGNLTMSPNSNTNDYFATTLTITTNAASYVVQADPDTLPTRSGGSETIPNWTTYGFGWNNESTQPTVTGFAGGGTGATNVFSCSGDSCQATGGVTQQIDINEKINYTIPAGVYRNDIEFVITSLSF